MMLAGSTLACPASRLRIGPARAIVARVEPIRIPAERAASPPAVAVVATEAISHGANPATMIPSRSEPAATSLDASHDKREAR